MVEYRSWGKVKKTSNGWQVFVKSPRAKSGYVMQGQPWRTKELALKDLKKFK